MRTDATENATRTDEPRMITHRPSARGTRNTQRVHWPRTLAAKRNEVLMRKHLRFRPKDFGAQALHCLVVDCSASMLAGHRLAAAKGLLLRLVQMAYEQRAAVALVGFAGQAAKVHLAPTLARPMMSRVVDRWLRPIRGGGGTPLVSGVKAAANLLARAARGHPSQTRWLWLLTDGRTLESPRRPADAELATIIDCEQQRLNLNRCRLLAERWRARYLRLADFTQSSGEERNA